jgi:hypothetical protein
MFSLTRHILCALFVVVAAGWYFWVALVEHYLTSGSHRDMFAWSLLFFAIFVIALIRTLIVTVVQFAGKKIDGLLLCRGIFIAAAVTSFWFRFDLISAADRVFLWANERSFTAKLSSITTRPNSGAVLHQISWYDVHKLLFYIDYRPLEDGLMSSDTSDALVGGLIGYSGCKVYVRRLQPNFYILNIDCRG